MLLQNLNQKISTCTKCLLHKTRTNVVPGAGNENADIFFIGEGPGKKEDLQGLPFIGAAGKFLDELLGLIKLTRDDVFIANVVKCRPPANRDPEPEEVTACWPYLEKQIEIIKPKLIVTLGRHSMYRFLPKELKISEVHGQPHEIINPKNGQSQIYYPIYHPAAALYNGSLREVLKADFKKIPKILAKINQSSKT
jgi:DNA polymerase